MNPKSPLSPVLAFLASCTSSAAAIGAETPSQPDVINAVPGGRPPLIIHNPDGTVTVQKAPVLGKTEGAARKGLVIPPQIIIPTADANDRRNEAR